MECTRTRADLRALSQLVDQEGNCKKCQKLFDEHPEASAPPAPGPTTTSSHQAVNYNFEPLLATVKNPLSPRIIRAMRIRKAKQVFLILESRISEAEMAQELKLLYEECELLPQTSTKMDWEMRGIAVNGSFEGNDQLLICFHHTVPHLLKMLDKWEILRIQQFHNDMPSFTPSSPPSSFISFSLLYHNTTVAMMMPKYSSSASHLKQRYDASSILMVFNSLEESLLYLHRNRYAHMDVKPDNIFITHDGKFILGDIGSIQRFGVITATTRAYIPTDILPKTDSPAASALIDWWMVASTLYDLVTDKLPHGCTSKQLMHAINECSMIDSSIRSRLFSHLGISSSS